MSVAIASNPNFKTTAISHDILFYYRTIFVYASTHGNNPQKPGVTIFETKVCRATYAALMVPHKPIVLCHVKVKIFDMIDVAMSDVVFFHSYHRANRNPRQLETGASFSTLFLYPAPVRGENLTTLFLYPAPVRGENFPYLKVHFYYTRIPPKVNRYFHIGLLP